MSGERGSRVAGREVVAAAAVSVAAVVFLGRLGVHGELSRDESVYAYAGQQFAHGVPTYAGIFDAKGPLATFLAGLGAEAGRVSGHSELIGIRLVFGLLACAGVLTTYLVARQVFDSTIAGGGAALALLCLPVFPADAFSGPDAKGPLVFLVTLAMWLGLTRRWFLAGACAALATLGWQPLLMVPVLIVVAAARAPSVGPARGRFREALAATAGVGAVLSACLVYFVATGTVGLAFDAGVRFPLEGVKHGQATVSARLQALADSAFSDGPVRGVLWCVGIVAFFWLLTQLVRGARESAGSPWRQPLLWLVVVPVAVSVAYCLVDYQGGPDLLPLLAPAALGLGGVIATLADRLRDAWGETGQRGFLLVVVLALLAGAWTVPDRGRDDLGCELARARDLVAAVPPGSDLWSFGDPGPLVLTERRNPDRFLYLASGVAAWKVKRTTGGLDGWLAQIRSNAPAVIVVGGYNEGDIYRSLIASFTSDGYRLAPAVGSGQVFLAPGVSLRSHLAPACRVA